MTTTRNKATGLLLLALATGCGVSARRGNDQNVNSTADVEAILRGVGAVPLDSFCGSSCRTILVDTVVRYLSSSRSDTASRRAPIAIPWSRLQPALRAGAELRPASYSPQRVIGDTASTSVYIARDALIESRREVGVVIDAPRRRGSVIRIFLQHDGTTWRVLETRVEHQ